MLKKRAVPFMIIINALCCLSAIAQGQFDRKDAIYSAVLNEDRRPAIVFPEDYNTDSADNAGAQITALSGRVISKEEMYRFVRKQIDSLHLKGISLAVICGGKVVYQFAEGTANQYTGDKISDHSMFEAASMGKPLFAYLVMRLVDKKVLTLDTPLYRYLPYPDIAYDDRYKRITTRMVLDHTTGFPNWRENDTLKIKFTPGTKFSYSGEGYEYLAKVLQHLTGTTPLNFDSLFRQEIAAPLAMEHSGYAMTTYIARNLAMGHEGDIPVYEPSDKYAFHPAGGLYSYPSDYAKFLIGMITGKLLSRESAEEMLRSQVELPEDYEQRKSNGITSWCLGFSIKPSPFGNKYIHGGNNWGYTSSCLFNREKKFGYVVFTNSNQVNEIKTNFEKFLAADR